jgi:hypothetical protein
VTAPFPLADACPACFPGDYPAVTPRLVTAAWDGSLRAQYVHAVCGTTWVTCWDAGASAWDEITGRRAS